MITQLAKSYERFFVKCGIRLTDEDKNILARKIEDKLLKICDNRRTNFERDIAPLGIEIPKIVTDYLKGKK